MNLPDEARFTEIFGRHRSAVLLYCRRRVGADQADDLMEEVFLTVWRRIDQAPATPDALPWLYRICLLVASNHWRGVARRWRLESKLQMLATGSTNLPGDQLVVREEVKTVVQLLGEMRPPDADILRLAGEELDTNEIAIALDISPAAASQRLCRARKRLTALYAKKTRGFLALL